MLILLDVATGIYDYPKMPMGRLFGAGRGLSSDLRNERMVLWSRSSTALASTE